jgi:ABC-type phosphate transport system auxiliary subunit
MIKHKFGIELELHGVMQPSKHSLEFPDREFARNLSRLLAGADQIYELDDWLREMPVPEDLPALENRMNGLAYGEFYSAIIEQEEIPYIMGALNIAIQAKTLAVHDADIDEQYRPLEPVKRIFMGQMLRILERYEAADQSGPQA